MVVAKKIINDADAVVDEMLKGLSTFSLYRLIDIPSNVSYMLCLICRALVDVSESAQTARV